MTRQKPKTFVLPTELKIKLHEKAKKLSVSENAIIRISLSEFLQINEVESQRKK